MPSGVGPGFRLSSHSASGGHENGAGIGVVGVTGVSVACVTFGESISTESSRRYAPHVSTACPERRAGVIVQRWIDRMLSAARDGIGSRSRRTDMALPVGSTRTETKNPAREHRVRERKLGRERGRSVEHAPVGVFGRKLRDRNGRRVVDAGRRDRRRGRGHQSRCGRHRRVRGNRRRFGDRRRRLGGSIRGRRRRRGGRLLRVQGAAGRGAEKDRNRKSANDETHRFFGKYMGSGTTRAGRLSVRIPRARPGMTRDARASPAVIEHSASSRAIARDPAIGRLTSRAASRVRDPSSLRSSG